MRDNQSEDDSVNNTSDTSSYASSDEDQKNQENSSVKEITHTIDEKIPMDMADEFEDNTVSSYAKFKT